MPFGESIYSGKRMRLEKWALIAEIASAVAVVLSLLFVGLQVRLGAEETAINTAAIRSSAYQELQTQIANLQVVLIENPELRSAVGRIVFDGQEAESADQETLTAAWLRLVFRHGEIAYMRYRDGLIDEAELQSVMGPVRGNFGSPYARDQWTGLSRLLNPDYVAYVNERILGTD
jgi:hypothetical protein